jgi:hypothetical protein
MAIFIRSATERMVCFTAAMIVMYAQAAAADPAFQLIEDETRHWYRGNMHTHSYWSDGDEFPEVIASWYRDHGYQFLVFTDHNVLHRGERWVNLSKYPKGAESLEKLKTLFGDDWIVTRKNEDKTEVRLRTFDEVFNRIAQPQKFLLIQGEEVTDRFKKLPLHFCASNLPELLIPMGGDSVSEVIQRNVTAAVSLRERTGSKLLIHLNHPNFGFAVTAEQLMGIDGEQFFEVYNGHPAVYNSGDEKHASTERMWDIINTWRLTELELPRMFGLATDDSHNYSSDEKPSDSRSGRGWVVVLAESLTPENLIDALEAGQFYSSSGVRLREVSFRDNTLKVTVEPQEGETYRIDFIGTRKGFNPESRPASDDPVAAEQLTRIYSADVGSVLQSVSGTEAVYHCTGNELYVRAVVTASRKHENPSEPGEFIRAWVQPVVPQPSP